MTQWYPTTQGELIRAARGEMTQAEFARSLALDRSCLCRYEKGSLGAPTKLVDHCLQVIANQLTGKAPRTSATYRALTHARQTVEELEALTKNRR